MTSPTSAPTKSHRGFTLIEMLVVIGILVLLMGILLPMVVRAVRSGDRARSSAELQSIAVALESYHQTFGDYPRSSAPATIRGSQVLLEALIAPSNTDGNAGPGFRKRGDGSQGPIYGPYLPLEKFKFDTTANELQDSFGNAILYVPARPTKPNINSTSNPLFIDDVNATAGNALYDARYLAPQLSTANFRYMMGDLNTNGQINGTEQPASTAPYILWSAGPDGAYGPAALNGTDAAKCDDVTNFR